MFDDIFELPSSPLPYVLALVGGAISLFTVSGGFSGAIRGGDFSPPGGIFMKIGVTVLSAVIGYVWGMKQSE